MTLARALRPCQHGDSPKAGSEGAGAWPTGDRSSGAVVRGMPGREAMTHLVPGEEGVSGGTTPGVGAWRLVRSNLTDDTKA
jgi:hypothetical protein